MGKHAYLIMAHNNFYLLEILIRMLDDARNDIYIHIDKKVKKFDFETFKQIPKQSNLTFIKRRKVNWGGFSQIQCELDLLQEAIKEKYDYYHLLSGVDLPIKSKKEIFQKIEENKGKIFLNFSEDEYIEKHNIRERLKIYHFLQEYLRRKQKWISLRMKALERVSLKVQNICKVNRLKKVNMEIKYGANWFSIPHNFAQYVLSKKEEIHAMFRFSNCCDEVFMQTLAYNSEFRKEIYDIDVRDSFHSCLRSIDWKRGQPYIYRSDDFEELINSEFLFARKLDEKVDKEIINKIYHYFSAN